MREPRAILITGASSGIGAALACEYAAPERVLFLGGRNEGRLADVAARCRAAGARAEIAVVDVLDADAMAAWIAACNDSAALDLVVANAGISAGTGNFGESPEQARRIMDTNVGGVINTVQPALDRFLERGDSRRRGQLAIMSSLASFRGFAGAPAYCASKASVRVYGEGLRNAYARAGIAVSVICPGFVETPMTDINDFPMPFLMSAERAARIVRRGLARDRARIAFPWPMYLAAWLLQTLPAGTTDWAMRGLPAKNAATSAKD